MPAPKQAAMGDIEDKICWTLTSVVQHLQFLQSLISSLPQTEESTFQTLIIEALETIPLKASTMARTTPDDQLKFLLSCVRHSNNGRVDFTEVANECGIVSKGAAAKRYERLLKANSTPANGTSTDTARKPTAGKPATSSGEPKPKAVHEKSVPIKKRKAEKELPLSPSKPDVKHSSEAQPPANKMRKVDPSVDSSSFMANRPQYPVRNESMPVGARGFLVPGPPLPPAYNNQVPRGLFQDFQGGRGMPPTQPSHGMPMAMTAMQPNQMGPAIGFEEYLNSDMYYQSSVPPTVQSQLSLLNNVSPMTYPLPPQEVRFLPQTIEASKTPELKNKKADGSIVIED